MNIENKNRACFSGHRTLNNTDEVREITERESRKLIERGVTDFYSGMALGYDMVASLAVLDLKKEYPQIRLIAVLPCPPDVQTKSWNDVQKAEYRSILEKADEVITLSQTYYRGCMHNRNRYMVEHSTYCICYLTEATGGTAYTVKHGKKCGLEIINIANILNETEKD